jgi:hypothetical protein
LVLELLGQILDNEPALHKIVITNAPAPACDILLRNKHLQHSWRNVEVKVHQRCLQLTHSLLFPETSHWFCVPLELAMASAAGKAGNEPLREVAEACKKKEWSKAIRIITSLPETANSPLLLCNRAWCYSKLELQLEHAESGAGKPWRHGAAWGWRTGRR